VCAGSRRNLSRSPGAEPTQSLPKNLVKRRWQSDILSESVQTSPLMKFLAGVNSVDDRCYTAFSARGSRGTPDLATVPPSPAKRRRIIGDSQQLNPGLTSAVFDPEPSGPELKTEGLRPKGAQAGLNLYAVSLRLVQRPGWRLKNRVGNGILINNIS